MPLEEADIGVPRPGERYTVRIGGQQHPRRHDLQQNDPGDYRQLMT
jgi:hypothetical protein